MYDADMKSTIAEVLSYIRDEITPQTLERFYINYRPDHTSVDIPENGQRFTELESHHYYEIAIQIEKQSCLQIGSRCYVLSKYQFCIIPRGEQHRLQGVAFSEHTANMLWISVTGEIVRTGYTTYSDTGRSKLYGTDLYIPGNFVIGEICAEQAAGGPGSAEAITSYLKMFFSLLLQKMRFDNESTGHAWTNAVVSELQQYIKDHLHESLPLQELSGYVALSPNYLCKLFKQVTGETITNYIQNLKISRSVEYLADPSIPLSEIAERLGFYDQFHFSKVFKAYTSMSPSKYRAALTQQGVRLPFHQAPDAAAAEVDRKPTTQD